MVENPVLDELSCSLLLNIVQHIMTTSFKPLKVYKNYKSVHTLLVKGAVRWPRVCGLPMMRYN